MAVDTPQGLANAQRSAPRDHGHVLDPSAGGARRRPVELERLALLPFGSDAHRRPDRGFIYAFETHRQPASISVRPDPLQRVRRPAW